MSISDDILKHFRRKSDKNYFYFKELRNKTQTLIYNAKRDYFKEKVENENHDLHCVKIRNFHTNIVSLFTVLIKVIAKSAHIIYSKSLWHSLKELDVPSKTGKASASAICLKIDGEVRFDRHIVAENSNHFYTTVASKLNEKLPKRIDKFGKQYVEKIYRLKGVKPNDYSFSVVSKNKVLKYLNNLSAKMATGLGGIPAALLGTVRPLLFVD